MANNFLPGKPDWQKFERSKLDRSGFVERFRRAESSISDHTHEFVTSRWRRIQRVRRPIIIWTLLIIMILLGIGLDVFFAQQRYQVFAAKESSYLEGIVGRISTLNPLFAETEADKLASQLLFSRLYHYDSYGKLKGDLAKSIVISPDELVYTIALNDNVKWHDGQKLTADDVKYTVDLFKNQAVNSFTGQVMRGVGVRVVSDYTVEFSLRSPYAPFVHLLDFAILPKHILGKIDNADLRSHQFNVSPIGSGKFKFASFKGDEKADGKQILALTYNQDYLRQSNIQRFELHTYFNQDKLVDGFKKGEVNAVATSLPIDDKIDRQKYDQKVTEVKNGIMAFFNMKRDRINNKKVRQALGALMSVEELRKVRFDKDGIYSEFDLPILKSDLKNQSVFFDLKFDKSLVDSAFQEIGLTKNQQAKWVDKDGKLFQLEVVSIKNTQSQIAADFLAEKMRQAGIEVNLKLVDLKDDMNVIQDAFKAKNYDILVYEINLGPDPDVYGFWHSSQTNELGINFSNYENQIIDEALATARLKRDLDLRTAKYNIFLQQWLNDIPAIGLFQANFYYVTQKGVAGYSGHQVIEAKDRYYDVFNWVGDRRAVYKTP